MAQHDDRHLTTEQLSALLDKQLSPQEQAEFNAHMQTCQQCQKVLAELKQTVALLRALPQPLLPRSFVLPATVARQQEQHAEAVQPMHPIHHVHPITTTTRRTRRHRLGHFARRSVQTLSTLAAVIGIVFILSSFVASFPHNGESTASTGSSAGPVNSPATQEPKISSHTTPNKGSPGATCGQSSPVPGPCGTQSPSTAKPLQNQTATGAGNGTPQVTSRESQKQANSSPIDLNSPQVHLGIGVILLLIGVLGVVLTRKRRE